TWSFFVITADQNFEKLVFAKPADRRRKLYNGRIETCYYQFHGQK
ncbi:MAG: class I SAM-dependent RNA methyltransferase, partial [Clostridiales bacterium]|nr:class I SAM-dependent RNA methyltransferase [Clostridiales bacterium]